MWKEMNDVASVDTFNYRKNGSITEIINFDYQVNEISICAVFLLCGIGNH